MPGIVDRLVAPEAAPVLADDAAVLTDDDPVGRQPSLRRLRKLACYGMDVNRSADGGGVDGVFVVVEAHQAGLRHRGWQGVEAIEATAVGDQERPFLLERRPDRDARPLGMVVLAGVVDALVGEQRVQLVEVFHPQPRREEALAHEADLVLDLPFFPARGRRTGDWFDKVMRAHLQKAAIVQPLLALKDRLTAVFMLS